MTRTINANFNQIYFDTQKIKLNIGLYMSNKNQEEDDQLINNIDFSCFYNQEHTEIFIEQLNSLFCFIEDCASYRIQDRYLVVINKFLDQTDFLQVFFNNQITKADFLVFSNIYNLTSYLNEENSIYNFIKLNSNLLAPFKTITFTPYNLNIILNYISKLLVQLQNLSYEQIVEFKDYLNTIYTDAEFFIDKKQDVGLE